MNRFGAKIRYIVDTFSEFLNLISPTCSMDFFTAWLLVTCLNWVHCFGDESWLGGSYVNTRVICCLVQGCSERGQLKGRPRQTTHYQLQLYTSCLEGSENMSNVLHQAYKTVRPVDAGKAIYRFQNHLHGIINHHKHVWGCCMEISPVGLSIITINHADTGVKIAAGTWYPL